VSAICLTTVEIDALLEKNFGSTAFSWIMISVGFISVKYLLNKDKQKTIPYQWIRNPPQTKTAIQ